MDIIEIFGKVLFGSRKSDLSRETDREVINKLDNWRDERSRSPPVIQPTFDGNINLYQEEAENRGLIAPQFGPQLIRPKFRR